MLTLSHRVLSIKIFVYSQLAPNLLAPIKCHQPVHLPDNPCTCPINDMHNTLQLIINLIMVIMQT